MRDGVRQPDRTRRASSSCGATRACRSTGTARCSARSAAPSRSGFSFRAWQKLARLSGADHLHTNGISNKFYETDDAGARLDRRGARAAARADARPCRCSRRGSGAASRTRPTPRSARPTCSCSPAAASTAIPTAPRPASTSMREAWASAARGESRRTTALAASGRAARRAAETFGPVACLTCGSRSTATTSPAASTRSCSSRAGGWTRAAASSGCRIADDLARAADEVDVVGIAGIARSLPTAEIEAEVRPVLAALAALGRGVVQYKACSTADSSPTRRQPRPGHRDRARACSASSPVPVLFAQPDFGRYTAVRPPLRRGGRHRVPPRPPADDVDGIRSTPMTESDLAVHLSRQTDLPIGRMPFTAYGDDPARARARLRAASEAALVLDALTDDHLAFAAAAITADAAAGTPRVRDRLRRPQHGSRARRSAGRLTARMPRHRPLNAVGPVLAVSGSRSPQTARQVDAAARRGLGGDRPAVRRGGPGRAVRDCGAATLLGAGRSVVRHHRRRRAGGRRPASLAAIAEAPRRDRRGRAARRRDPPRDRLRRRHLEPRGRPARRRVALDRREPVGNVVLLRGGRRRGVRSTGWSCC